VWGFLGKIGSKVLAVASTKTGKALIAGAVTGGVLEQGEKMWKMGVSHYIHAIIHGEAPTGDKFKELDNEVAQAYERAIAGKNVDSIGPADVRQLFDEIQSIVKKDGFDIDTAAVLEIDREIDAKVLHKMTRAENKAYETRLAMLAGMLRLETRRTEESFLPLLKQMLNEVEE